MAHSNTQLSCFMIRIFPRKRIFSLCFSCLALSYTYIYIYATLGNTIQSIFFLFCSYLNGGIERKKKKKIRRRQPCPPQERNHYN